MSNILIIGGTGNTGKHIVDLFVKFSNYNLIVAARNKKKLVDLQKKYGNRLKIVQVDAKNKITKHESLKNINVIVLAAPTYNCFLNSIMLAVELNCKFLDIQCSFENKFNFLKNMSANNLIITDAGLWPGSVLSISRYLLDKDTKSVEVSALFNKPDWQELVNEETLQEHNSLDNEYAKKKCVLQNNTWIHPSKVTSKIFDFWPYGIYDLNPTYLKEIYEIKKYVPLLENFGIYAKTDVEDLNKNMTVIKFFANDTIKLEIYHDCGWFITAAATVSTVFQMIDSEKIGVFLSGVFLDPSQYVNDLRRLGVQINICQRGSI